MSTKRTQRLLLALIGLLLPSGCAHLYDPIDETLACLHCEVQAAQTWHYMRSHYAHVAYPHHFGAGFRAGYVSVCRGRGQCPPTLPPKTYWRVWYRNAAGHEKALEWFNGFRAGAAVAMQEGHTGAGAIVTAPGSAGSCDCHANDVPFELPGVHSPSSEPSAPPFATESPWELRETSPAFPAPDESAEQFPAGPHVPPSSPSASPDVPLGTVPETESDPQQPAPPDSPANTSVETDSETTAQPPMPAASQELPFGHSIGAPFEPEVPVGSSEQTQGEETNTSESLNASPGESAKDKTGTSDTSETTGPRNDTRAVPDYQSSPPPSDQPPLENRFLPRGTATGVNSSRHSRPPRSLLEAIGRIQHTSHTAR